MNEVRNGVILSKSDAEEKEENHLDGILDSNARRRVLTRAVPADANNDANALEAQMKAEQKLRWNFDFETETPLPGRYQWVRTYCLRGHDKGSSGRKLRKGEAKSKSARKCFYFKFCNLNWVMFCLQVSKTNWLFGIWLLVSIWHSAVTVILIFIWSLSLNKNLNVKRLFPD